MNWFTNIFKPKQKPAIRIPEMRKRVGNYKSLYGSYKTNAGSSDYDDNFSAQQALNNSMSLPGITSNYYTSDLSNNGTSDHSNLGGGGSGFDGGGSSGSYNDSGSSYDSSSSCDSGSSSSFD